VLEDHSLLQPGGPEAGARGHGGFFASTADSAVRNLILARRGGSFRLGVAALGVGAPISAREYADSRGISFAELGREDRVREVRQFSLLLMQAINEVIPPAAVPLVARILIESPETTVAEGSLISRARSLAGDGEPLDYEAAVRTLILRGLVSAGRDGYRCVPGGEKLLAYYANLAYR
jgi:hypothetical protein